MMVTEKVLQQAISHHKAGKLSEAEALYRVILKEESMHPDANHNLGVLLKQGDKADIALPLFKTALESNPNQGQYWVSYIDTLIHLGQLDAARSVLEQGQSEGLKGDGVDQLLERLALLKGQVNKKNPSGPSQVQVDSVISLYSQGQVQEALSASQMLIKDYPNSPLLYNISGACYNALGQLEAAVKQYKQALVINPGYAEVHSNLGATLQELGQLDAAVKCYQQALSIKPDYAEAHNNLGVTLNELRQLEVAVKHYEQALAIKPDYAEAHSNLGNTLKELGQLDAAVKRYEQALAIKPDYAEAHNNLGVALNDLGQLESAVKRYEQALAIKPDYAEAHNNFGVTLNDLGQLESAVKSYEQALAIKSDYAEAHSNLGNTLKDLGQLEEAVKNYEQALAIKPDCADALIPLGIYSWIDQDLDKLKSYTTSKMDLNKCSKKSLKFINPYLAFLTRLHNHRLTNTHEYLCNNQYPVIHVIGESYCLTVANSNVEFMGKSYTMRSNIIMGCKAWHLANDQLNSYKRQFETMVTSIPTDGIVLITIGDIDCRLNEGIIKFHQKMKNNLGESIKDLAQNYIKYITEKLAASSRTIIVSGVPCISKNLQQKLTEEEVLILSTVLNDFNNSLKTTSINKGLRFLDIYSLTQENPEAYFIDDRHLTPSAMIKAMQTKLI
jgi:tetratricopeptide (TPR) repeat protein